ncbi:MAG: putative Ig domain-containing protein [Nitrospira sp.]|nr:putative Ig domain-containing protein [Nitrospira sp.]
MLVTDVHTWCSRVTRPLFLVLGVCVFVFNSSCTGGSSPDPTEAPAKGNQPPVITSAKILADPISLTGPVEVQVDAQDPEREAVSFEYQWYVDDAPLANQTNATLPADLLRRGQTVAVEIIPTDGANKGRAYRTKSVAVGNTAPRVMTISLTPQAARAGDKLEVEVDASDPDHDRVDLTYKWYRNDTVIKEGEDSFLDTAGFVAPDRIAVEVTASDPAGSAHSSKSEPLILSNSGPTIVSTPPAAAVQGRFDYSVTALDPDGDPLTYHLEMAPPGMTINSGTGHIGWQIPADQRGTFRVKVVAKDGHGGLATQEFDLTLTAAIPVKPPGA